MVSSSKTGYGGANHTGIALENEDLWKEEWAETYWESKDKFGSFIDIA